MVTTGHFVDPDPRPIDTLDCVLIAIGVFAVFVALASCLSGCSTVTAIAACAISVCN